jgi:hypothetical protein
MPKILKNYVRCLKQRDPLMKAANECAECLKMAVMAKTSS